MRVEKKDITDPLTVDIFDRNLLSPVRGLGQLKHIIENVPAD
jgi:hypothetical protein